MFHLGRYQVFARLISAATGGGKTLAGAFDAVMYAYQNPGSVSYWFEPNFKMVKRNLIPALDHELLLGKPFYSHPWVSNYNRTDSRIDWRNGSQSWLIGLDDPESAEGPNVDYIWGDEVRLLGKPDVAFDVWIRRLRGSIPGKYHICLSCTTTPNEPGSVIFNHFEHPELKLENSKVYRWDIDANIYLTEEAKNRIKRAHTGGMYDRFVLGRFAAVGEGTFSFDSTIHTFKSIDKAVIKQVIYGVDFGWTNPSAIIAVGYDGDGRTYVLEEFYQARVHVETLIQEAKEMQQQWGSGIFYCDSSEPRTIEEMRLAGIDAVANKSKREEGFREVGGRLIKQADNRYRLMINESCVNLIFEMQVFQESKKENDHAVSALRYALASTIRGPPLFFVESF